MLGCCLQQLQACPYLHAANKQQVRDTVGMQCAVQQSAAGCNRGCTVRSLFLLHLCRVSLDQDLVDTCDTVLPDCQRRNAPTKHFYFGVTHTACHRCSNSGPAHRAAAQLTGCTIDWEQCSSFQPCGHCDVLPWAPHALWLCDYTVQGKHSHPFPGSG